MSNPHVVIVDANAAGIHILSVAKARGYEVSYIECAQGPRYYPADVGAHLKAQVDRVITVGDTASATDLEQALRTLAGQRPVHGLVCLSERCILAAATAAAGVGIPFTDADAVTLCREKHRARAALAAQHVPSAGFGTAHAGDEAAAVARRIGFPVIAKPSSGTASLLAEVCRDEDELAAYFARLSDSRSTVATDLGCLLVGPILIEELLVGRMVSAEVVACQGLYGVLAIGERRRAQVNQAWELGTTFPAPVAQAQQVAICDYAVRVARALGLQLGIFHLEIMLTDYGPRLIEANPRVMGGNGRALIQAAYGFDIFESVLDVHVERRWRAVATSPEWYSVSHVLAAAETAEGRAMSERDLPRSTLGEVVKFAYALPPGGIAPKYRCNLDTVGVIITRAREPQQAARLCETMLDETERVTGLRLLR